MFNSEAITKIQSLILVAVIVVAAAGGVSQASRLARIMEINKFIMEE